jgi:hypothetical protein
MSVETASAAAPLVSFEGKLLGRHTDAAGRIRGEIIHVMEEGRPRGPAENAFVYLDLSAQAGPRARYLSWINLYDIETAARRQPGEWHLIEGTNERRVDACWIPFGWGAPPFPSVADVPA